MKSKQALVLFLTIITLAMTGCVEDKPMARLDSPDDNERLRAVEEVRNKYGSHAATPTRVNETANTLSRIPSGALSAADRQAIVGRWQHETGEDLEFLQFAADGTFQNIHPVFTMNGNWRLLSADTIELSALKSGNRIILFDSTVLKGRFRLDGDTLWLAIGGDWASYTKTTDKEEQP